jgi:hypothetical protein
VFDAVVVPMIDRPGDSTMEVMDSPPPAIADPRRNVSAGETHRDCLPDLVPAPMIPIDITNLLARAG